MSLTIAASPGTANIDSQTDYLRLIKAGLNKIISYIFMPSDGSTAECHFPPERGDTIIYPERYISRDGLLFPVTWVSVF